jgi:glycosyltransferase 2 family protein
MLASHALGARHSLAIFGAERLADLLCLLLLCLPGVVWLASHEGVKNSRTVMMALAALGLLLLVGLAAALWFRAALSVRFGWLREAWHCLTVQPLVWFALTLTAWAGQGVAAWLVCRELGVDITLMTVTGFYAVAMVAGALSALPAGLGGTEAVLAGLLAAHGAAPGTALTVTVLIRLLTLWLAVAIGVMTLLYSAAIRREISLR